jgi:hypothetical protein
MSEPYHSALKPDLFGNETLDYFERAGSVVAAHDIQKGAIPAFMRSDAIYAEPAWRDGYLIFAKRAGISADKTQYREYLSAIRGVIDDLRVPAYLVIGKHMIKALSPDHTVDLKLHGYPCHLAIWNADRLSDVKKSEDVLPKLAEQYSCILDFCCGYGNTARAISVINARALCIINKRFVCTDINKKCVAYIARAYMGWLP